MGKAPPQAPVVQPPPRVVIEDTESKYKAPKPGDVKDGPESALAGRDKFDADTAEAAERQKNEEEMRKRKSIASTIVSSPLLADEDPEVLKTILG